MGYSTTGAIDAYYEGQKAPINAQMENSTAAYEAALQKLEQTKAQQDAQAYRSYVRQQKELPSIMRASGNHGGMVDSAVASLLNKYNQGKSNRAIQLQGDTANQELQYQSNMNELRAKLAALEQQAAADKAELAYQNSLRRGKDTTDTTDLYKDMQPGGNTSRTWLTADPYNDSVDYYGTGPKDKYGVGNIVRQVADDRYFSNKTRTFNNDEYQKALQKRQQLINDGYLDAGGKSIPKGI